MQIANPPSAPTVFVTGASGFVGMAVVKELLRRGLAVRAHVNRKPLPLLDGDIRSIKGDLFDPSVLSEGISGCAAVVHLVGIIMENPSNGRTFEHMHVYGTRAVLDATLRAGVKRYIHMSALGTRENARSEYHRTKFRAEKLVRETGLDWTIFRPSMIHGPGGEFMAMEAAWARGKAPPYVFMPYFGAGVLGGGGSGKMQPVFVDDVARAIVDAVDKPRAVRKIYEMGGTDRLTWPQMHRIASSLIAGKARRAVPIPAWYAELLTRVVPARLLPFNEAQVVMSREDNVCDMHPFVDDFGWLPGGFEESLRQYAALL